MKIFNKIKLGMKDRMSVTSAILMMLLFCAVMIGSFETTETEQTISETQMSENETEYENIDEATPEQSLTAAAPEPESKKEISELQIHFIDVGQGDATLIICDGHAMLLDAGENDKGTAIQMYLKKQGVEKLDYMIGTHPDSDHIGGMDVVLTKFDCDTIVIPNYAKDTATYRDVIQAMDYKSYINTLPVVGKEYSLGDAVFTIIAPNNNDYGDESNNYSVGIKLVHGENSFVFTGDAEEQAEADILKSGIDIGADVLKVGHHGSKTASLQSFIDEVSPEYAIISCGEGNSYGHPHAATLNTLRAAGIKVFRTDEQGSVVVSSDGNGLTWNCAPSESWQAGEPTGNVQKADAVSDAAVYICNKNTKKFHYSSCSSVEQMADKNKLETKESRDSLISQGYNPCKRCKP